MTTLLICASLQDKGLSWSETLLAGENLYTEPSRCPGRRVTFRTSPRAKWDDILSSDSLNLRHSGSWLANPVHAHADTDAGILQILIFTVMMAILSTPPAPEAGGFSVEISTLGAMVTFLIQDVPSHLISIPGKNVTYVYLSILSCWITWTSATSLMELLCNHPNHLSIGTLVKRNPQVTMNGKFL